MPKNISLKEFNDIIGMLHMLKNIGLLDDVDFVVTWMKKPQLTINAMGDFEFENPQEVYGCIVEFWTEYAMKPLGSTRFNIVADDENV